MTSVEFKIVLGRGNQERGWFTRTAKPQEVSVRTF